MDEEGFPLGLHLLGIHTHALVDALEWALRLEMCGEWEGSADFLRDLTNDPRPSRILHSRSQLAQASLAARMGWSVALEPTGGDGIPADLSIISPSEAIVAEVRVLTPSQFGRSQRELAEEAHDWIFWLGHEHQIWIGGSLGHCPTAAERQRIEDFVRREAARARAGEQPAYSGEGIALTLSKRGTGAPALTTPPVREGLFDRMARVISEKAEKMSGSGAQWLHVTVLTGLWRFTEWGRGPLPRKAPQMSSALNAVLGDRCPAGICLTCAPGLAPADMPEEIATSPAGASLRIGIEGLRARESLIMPFSANARQAADNWLDLARSEADWLSWALAEKGLPSLDAVLKP